MPTEQCAGCGATVSLHSTVHVMVNTMDDEGVRDGYLCRSCHEERLADLFE